MSSSLADVQREPAADEPAPSLRSDEPVVQIPSGGWARLDVRELHAYRELLYFLVWRDVKIRYKQTALGVAWAVIQPLFSMLTFTLLFGKLAKMPSEGIPYPLFAYSALVLWTFFSTAITTGSNSLVNNSNLISKVYFPRLLVPTATVGAALVDLAIAFAVLVGLMAWYHVSVGFSILALPLFVAMTAVLALGAGIWLAATNVRFRDIRHAVPFMVQLWMFASPIIYPTSLVPGRWRMLLAVNPLVGIIEGFRASLFGRPIEWTSVGISLATTVLVFVTSILYFQRIQKTFADMI